MERSVFCALSYNDEPIRDKHMVLNLLRSLGMPVLKFEVEDLENGMWTLELADEYIERLRSDGYLEMEKNGYRLEAEMP
jgi:hypothetical protein